MSRTKTHRRPRGSSSQADGDEEVGKLESGLRLFLYLSAGVAGAAIMIVEILGAKILAPYVGTSHFVWTAQIGVTLAALASGYYVGGRLADSRPSLTALYVAVFTAAAWLALTVVVLKPVAYAFIQLPLTVASLLSSTLLYFVPLSLLAMCHES